MGVTIRDSNASTYRDSHVHIPRCQTGSRIGVGGKPVRYLPSCIGSIKIQRKMKCSNVAFSPQALSLYSHLFFLPLNCLNPKLYLLPRLCSLSFMAGHCLFVSLLVHLAFCHGLPTSECYHENMCIFNLSLPSTSKCSQSCTQRAAHRAMHGAGPWTAK